MAEPISSSLMSAALTSSSVAPTTTTASSLSSTLLKSLPEMGLKFATGTLVNNILMPDALPLPLKIALLNGVNKINIQDIGASASKNPALVKQFKKENPLESIEKQMANNDTHVVIKREIIADRYLNENNTEVFVVDCKEQVIDKKFLQHKYQMDSRLNMQNKGEAMVPQSFSSLIDTSDITAYNATMPYLENAKLEPAQYRLKKHTFDIKSTNLNEQSVISKDKSLVSDKIKERDWYKPDISTRTFRNKDVVLNKDIQLSTLNKSVVTSKNFTNEEFDLRYKNNSINEAKTLTLSSSGNIKEQLLGEDIVLEEKSALVWTKENIIKSQKEYTSIEDGYEKNWMRNMLGTNISTSETNIAELSNSSVESKYISSNPDINVKDFSSYEASLKKISELKLDGTSKISENLLREYQENTARTEFKEGWISYVPLGDYATIATKKDFGAKITCSDYFWAGLDTAFIAIAILTWGQSLSASGQYLAVRTAGKAVVKVGAKQIAKHTTKLNAKSLVKNGAKSSLKKASTSIAPSVEKVSLKLGRQEAMIYKNANLKKMVINNKNCRVRSDIDIAFKDALGRTNLERMKAGLAPLEKNTGLSHELHHILQNPKAGLAQLTRAEHRLGANNKILHTVRNNSPIEHGKAWDLERANHWKEFAKTFTQNI